MAKITLDPITRIEGHLKIEVEIDSLNRVTAAHASGTMFRGFENILIGRDPRDAVHITQRICGVCPVPHATAAVEALEQAFGITISANARLLRNLVQGTDFVSDHILHFYHLALLDYIKGPAIPPFTPTHSTDYRFSASDNQLYVDHYVKALEMRRIGHEAGALFAGKVPGAYSWLKAPRLLGEVYELGALARMTVNNEYVGGISVMDRHRARALEARKVAYAMKEWLYGLAFDNSGYRHITQMPASGRGEGFTEATRGGLGHWFEYAAGKLTRYQVITPTCWNASPRDDSGVPGAIEQALTGVTVANPAEPVELYRIVRSFDPCMGCAVHVTDADRRLVAKVVMPQR